MNNILIKTKRSVVEHKMRDVMGDGYCWWNTGKTPKRNICGGWVYFTDGEVIYARGRILGIEPNNIIFEPLERCALSMNTKAPYMGWKYV